MSDINFNSASVRPVTPIEGKALSAFTADSANIGTANKFQTARKINGVDFDGTADITLPGAILNFDSEIKSFITT